MKKFLEPNHKINHTFSDKIGAAQVSVNEQRPRETLEDTTLGQVGLAFR